MVGAAIGRRAGPASAVTALVFALIAAAGCGSPPAPHRIRHSHSHVRVEAAVREAKPSAATLPRVPGGLPSPVVLRTSGGLYAAARSGVIRWLRSAPAGSRAAVGQPPAGSVWTTARPSSTWGTLRGGHLLIVRNKAVVWRSKRRYRVSDAAHMNVIMTGRPGIAFEVRPFGPLFMARWRGPEHVVASGAWPVMWSRTGNLIAALQRRGSRRFGYAVFSPAGVRVATLASGLSSSAFDQFGAGGAGTFWYLTDSGDVVRTDGAATSVIANARALGFSSLPALSILAGGMIQLLSVAPHWRQGQVVLYPDGQVFARISTPKGQAIGFGALSASPGGQMVAYILYDSSGVASTVFLVRPGSPPVAVYHTARAGGVCSVPPLAWHGSWLLYTPPLGRAVLIDTAAGHRVIRLPFALPARNGGSFRVRAVAWR